MLRLLVVQGAHVGLVRRGRPRCFAVIFRLRAPSVSGTLTEQRMPVYERLGGGCYRFEPDIHLFRRTIASSTANTRSVSRVLTKSASLPFRALFFCWQYAPVFFLIDKDSPMAPSRQPC